MFKSMKKTARLAISVCLSLGFVACGGGNSSTPETSTTSTPSIPTSTTPTPTVLTGVLKIGGHIVEGLSFRTTSQMGDTNSNGEFKYQSNETITFYLGNISLPAVLASAKINSLALFSSGSSASPNVQNLYRFLVMLDNNRNLTDGIQISAATKAKATTFPAMDFSQAKFEADAATVIAQLSLNAKDLPAAYATRQFGSVSTLTTITTPYGDDLIVAPSGNLLISGGFDKATILAVTPSGQTSEFAKNLPGPVGLGFDSFGNLYASNYSGNSITKITPEGTASVFASNLAGPAGLYINKQDEIFVTLYGPNFNGRGNTVLKFDLQGNQSVYATRGSLSGPDLGDLIGITGDEFGNLYVSNYSSSALFKITKNGAVGKTEYIGSAGGDTNQIDYANGYVYLPSTSKHLIHRAAVFPGSEGEISTFAGTGTRASTDGSLAASAFSAPNNIAANGNGSKLYVLDKNGKIRVIE